MKTRGLATPKLSSDYIYDDPNSISNPSPTSSMLRPLVKCPSCPKSFSLLRSLYGHFGSSHAKYGGIKLNHDKILFGCPYCEIDEVEFMTLKGVESHVENYHEDCKLLSEVSTSTSNIAATNSETEVSLDDVKEQSLTRRLISHPLGKCPRCPKILSLRGVGNLVFFAIRLFTLPFHLSYLTVFSFYDPGLRSFRESSQRNQI